MYVKNSREIRNNSGVWPAFSVYCYKQMSNVQKRLKIAFQLVSNIGNCL
ncbi:hypothetical protein BRO54_1681 [Geobacillus proteiniphilus]|uniref:Uncharacterized protein n=1 Tax=Geobacillus proteiniphilus TaxID=860353 RepID=A0A1Q5T1T9_9BACL|nr:hypothetical protein BRO54_1681 [Geobacillus proteiniphilus]